MKTTAKKTIAIQQILEFRNEEDMLFLLSVLKSKGLVRALKPLYYTVGGKHKIMLRLPCGKKDISPLINEFCFLRPPMPYEKAYFLEYGKTKAL